jgi:hypothetical protein
MMLIVCGEQSSTFQDEFIKKQSNFTLHLKVGREIRAPLTTRSRHSFKPWAKFTTMRSLLGVKWRQNYF